MVHTGSKLERLRVCFHMIDVKRRENINQDEMRTFIAQFWLQPVERIGAGKKKKEKVVVESMFVV